MGDVVDLRFVTDDTGLGEWLFWADSFTDVTDLVDQAIASLEPGQRIGRLTIAGHGSKGSTGYFCFDVGHGGAQYVLGTPGGVNVDPTVAEQLERLAPYLDPDQGVVEFRVCEAGTGINGQHFTQAVADLVGVPVTAPMDEMKSVAIFGGLTVNWLTAYPSVHGTPPKPSFWVGEGMGAVPASGEAPPTAGLTVPLPGVDNSPTAPATTPEAEPAGPPQDELVATGRDPGAGSSNTAKVVGVSAAAAIALGAILFSGGGGDEPAARPSAQATSPSGTTDVPAGADDTPVAAERPHVNDLIDTRDVELATAGHPAESFSDWVESSCSPPGYDRTPSTRCDYSRGVVGGAEDANFTAPSRVETWLLLSGAESPVPLFEPCADSQASIESQEQVGGVTVTYLVCSPTNYEPRNGRVASERRGARGLAMMTVGEFDLGIEVAWLEDDVTNVRADEGLLTAHVATLEMLARAGVDTWFANWADR